jgi:S-formylglutathione hydrolase FrmB
LDRRGGITISAATAHHEVVPLTRRSLLIGAGAAVAGLAVGTTTGAGQRALDRLAPGAEAPTGAAGPLVDGTLPGGARWAAAYPPGSTQGDSLPVVLVLHGRGNDVRDVFGPHALQHHLAGAVRSGTPPFVLAAADGGESAYWHRRADGRDPQGVLLDELLPLLADRGLATARFGLTGWSMGGYGALLLATRVPSRVLAVVADAPALWRRAADTAAGAFDGPDDFAAHDVLTDVTPLRDLPVRIACGRSDPFAATARELADALPDAERSFPRGGHDLDCWHGLRPADMRFLGRHIAS